MRCDLQGVWNASAEMQELVSDWLACVQGVVGAATGAGLIIGTYFAFYSTTKRFLKDRTTLSEGAWRGCQLS